MVDRGLDARAYVSVRARPEEEARPPSSRATSDDRVLTSDGYRAGIRWHEGERLEQLFEEACDAVGRGGRQDALAVDGPDGSLSYAELDARANRLARFLVDVAGVEPGYRVGLLFDQAVDGYVSMLAVLKARGVYVPLDVAYPADRLAYIAQDASMRVVLSRSHLASRAGALGDGIRLVHLDEVDGDVARQSGDRLGPGEVDGIGDLADDLCYVIYTSGTTGRPKGVAVAHAGICNFVRVAAEVYGVTAEDRVYQGLTIAFDFSVEEIWVAWMAGATLVPKPGSGHLLGPDLDAYLQDQRVTALCCVPTLLATLVADHPDLRFLLVSGESCPEDLVQRWARPGRRFLNVYGPTEATVTATWTLLRPGRPVTIGVPLPTYSVVILDVAAERALVRGEVGEIGIAGIGLAEGYLDRPDLTERAFVPDFVGMPDNPSARIYRTGDLGRINDDGEIEYHGRIDSQVKIRGYRIELAEIESVLLELPGVAQVVLATYEPDADTVELVAYYTVVPGAVAIDADAARERLRDRLPAYMVPAYLEQLATIPMATSGKVDRRGLPPPSGERWLAGRGEHHEPETPLERLLADRLACVLDLERVSVDAHFFDDLGASSLLMARFNAALRDQDGWPPPSMKDVYLHPTVRRLAAAVADASPAPAAVPSPGAAGRDRGQPAGLPRYALCGALQLLAFVIYVSLDAIVLARGATWLTEGRGLLELYGRAVALGGGVLLGMGLLPVLAKWALIGRWKPRRIRVWSLDYLRFWVVKTLVLTNPLAQLTVGTPLYGLYLRALGAQIGRGAVVFTRHVPVCTDLLRVGEGSVIRKDAYLSCYRARDGVIEIGAVTLGADVFVGEHTVLDIDTAIEDGAQLGHSSALHAGQVVTAGRCWHGSPAQPAGAEDDYRGVAAVPCGRARRAAYGALRLVAIFAVLAPVAVGVEVLLQAHPRVLGRLSEADAPLVAAVVLAGLLTLGLLVAGTVPRLLSRALEPGKAYPLYGLHYTIQRVVASLSNLRPLLALLGDSSAVVSYLRLVGYRLGQVQQTGTNFGTSVKHEVPSLSEVGTGTMVSDGLSMLNADFSSSSFRVVPTVIGARNYLGNDIVYPPGGRTGDDCLLATKALVPISGPVREGVGLLGSPAFEIPRSVARDRQFDHLHAEPERTARLRAKLRHNVVTMALHLLVRYLLLVGVVLIALSPLGGPGWQGWAGTLATIVMELAFGVALFVLVERVVTGFYPLEPRFCSIYQIEFWRHERYWKVPSTTYIQAFNGTPFKTLIWRLLGVQIDGRVFDDGAQIVERTLVSIGPDVTLNMGTTLQPHTLEDGAFKSDHIRVGAGCTIGTGAFVNYGVVMEDGSELDADSFAMKGSRLSAGACWSGNPAAEISAGRASYRPGSESPTDVKHPDLTQGHPAASRAPART